jgi:hypothetical protein
VGRATLSTVPSTPPVEDHLVQPGHHPFLAVLTAPFCRGEEVVGLLAAESLVEPGRVPGVILAVEDERGTGDQWGVAFEGVGGEGAEDSGGAVCSEDPHTPRKIGPKVWVWSS